MCDISAYKKYPKHNWIYYKPSLCDLQNIPWYPCPIEPHSYPAVVRPVTNLSGMGSEMYIVYGKEEFYKVSCYGYFSTPLIDGIHTSHDFDVIDGVIQNETAFQGHKNIKYPGTFLYWELLYKHSPPTITNSIQILLEALGEYTGPLNIECIDGKIIEAHLRRGDVDEINDEEAPFYIVPIWGSKHDTKEINIENIIKEPGVIRVIKDPPNISKTSSCLKRKGLVFTKILPDFT